MGPLILRVALATLLFAVAAHAEPHRIYVSNEQSGTVTVIDGETLEVARTIEVGWRPRGIRATADGSTIFVALSDLDLQSEGDGDAIVAIDAATGTITARYGAGTDPEQFAIDSRGERLYAANEDAGTATITDVKTGKTLATLVVGIEPEGVGISADDRWVYVTAETSNTVSVIDTEAMEVALTFLVEPRPRAVIFESHRPRAWVSAEIGGAVSLVDTESHEVIDTIDLGGDAKPVGMALSPEGSRLYVANGHSGTVAIVDTETLRQQGWIRVGKRPWNVALSPDGRILYAANGISNDVSVIDLESGKLLRTIEVGQRPWGIVTAPIP